MQLLQPNTYIVAHPPTEIPPCRRSNMHPTSTRTIYQAALWAALLLGKNAISLRAGFNLFVFGQNL